MAERATIARPYAKAAFSYARGANRLAEWSQALRTGALIVADPRVAEAAKNPKWTAADLAGLVADVGGSAFDPAMQNFIHVLAENRRLLLLPEISGNFETLRAAVENTIDVEVISAAALDAAQRDKLERALAVRFKRRVHMKNSVDAALLGGAVVRAGDFVIDGSLKGRLDRLAGELAS